MDNLKLIEPYPMFGPGSEAFPDSPEKPEGSVSVTWRDQSLGSLIDLKPNVVYQSLSGEDQHLQIFTPVSLFPPAPGVPAPFYPVVVYVPGSAWHRQNVWMALDKARYFVSNGYAFVVVEYRPSEIAPFPAQIDDLMSALRFLGKNAALYSLDADRLALWGDSSGGHTVVSAAVNHPEIAKCVVDYFGPTDISLMNYYPSAMDHHGADSPEGFLLGKVNVLENPELAQKTNPLNGISPSKPLPPIMIMHGSKDNVVPFNQSVRLYEKLRECKKEVSFYRLEGAGHGIGGFNSDECLKTTLDWIARYTKSV